MTMPTLRRWVVDPATGLAIRLQAINSFADAARLQGPPGEHGTRVLVYGREIPVTIDVSYEELARLIAADDILERTQPWPT